MRGRRGRRSRRSTIGRADEQTAAEILTATGFATAASAAGASVGVFLGPEAAIATAFIIPPVQTALQQALRRVLGSRERNRLVTALDVAHDEMQRQLDAGAQPRSDGLFSDDERSGGDEIAEGILRAAQREYEERKVPYLGRMLARIAFDSTIDRATANHLIRVMEQLSYRQLLILRLFAQPSPGSRRQDDYRDGRAPNPSIELITLLSEIFDLYQRGLVNNGGAVALGLTSLKPAQLQTQGMGGHLGRLSFPDATEDANELNSMSRILDDG